VEGRRLSSGPVTVSVGRLQVEFLRTGENNDFTYALIHFGGHDFHCAVRPFAGIQEFRRFLSQLEDIFPSATITELLRVVDTHFGENYYGLQHLLAEEREEVLDALFGHLTERFAEMYTRLYQDNYRSVNALIDTGLKVPREFRIAAEYVLSRQLNELVRLQQKSRNVELYSAAQEIVREASRRGYRLDKSEAEEIFEQMIGREIEVLVERPTTEGCRALLDLLGLARSLQIELNLGLGQELLFDRIAEGMLVGADEQCVACFRELLEQMRMSPGLIAMRPDEEQRRAEEQRELSAGAPEDQAEAPRPGQPEAASDGVAVSPRAR
jgi:hypothetical protein